MLCALQHGYLGFFQTGICFARSLCFFKGSESIGDCLCSCASNPPRQVLLACRAASFIKVNLPKAFPSFFWFNEEPEHPLDASLWLLGHTASRRWSGFALSPWGWGGCHCHHLQNPALGKGRRAPKSTFCCLNK